MSDPISSPENQSVEATLVVKNKLGIHARPAAMIVRLANKYDADVFVQQDDDQVNGKSIMGIMMLAAGKGTKLKFTAVGAQAKEMMREMGSLFERDFQED